MPIKRSKTINVSPEIKARIDQLKGTPFGVTVLEVLDNILKQSEFLLTNGGKVPQSKAKGRKQNVSH